MKKIMYSVCMLFLAGLLACKSTQNKPVDNADETAQGIWRFEAKNKFSLQDEVVIMMYHEQKNALRLLRPLEMKLEVEENGAWRLVRRLYCICLENCPPPPREREIAPKERFTFRWKPEEKWCEPTLKTLPAPVGKYRLVINHLNGLEKKLNQQYYEFSLTK